MTARFQRERPTFFWQGSLLMLPVVVLAVVGLVSLRRDEQAAEAEARQKALENARALARAISPIVNHELQRYFVLNNSWIVETRIGAHITIHETNVSGFQLPLAKLRHCPLIT